MALAIQYDLFESNDEVSLLKKEIELMNSSLNNTRRGLFARHSAMAKQIMDMQEEIERLKGIRIVKSKSKFGDFEF